MTIRNLSILKKTALLICVVVLLLITALSLECTVFTDDYAMWRQHLLTLVLAAALTAAILIFFFHRLVLGRLSTLGREIEGLGDGGNLACRLSGSGNDEIGTLICRVNGLLDRVQRLNREQQRNEAISRVLSSASPTPSTPPRTSTSSTAPSTTSSAGSSTPRTSPSPSTMSASTGSAFPISSTSTTTTLANTATSALPGPCSPRSSPAARRASSPAGTSRRGWRQTAGRSSAPTASCGWAPPW